VSDVVFLAEQRGGALRRAALESATVARKLADGLGGRVHGLLIGEGVSGLVADLGKHGADEVHVVEGGEWATPAGGAVADALVSLSESVSPKAIVIATSAMGRDVAPRVAARLGAGYAGDCIDVAADGGRITAVRPMYAGKVRGSVAWTGDGAAVSEETNLAMDANQRSEVMLFDLS